MTTTGWTAAYALAAGATDILVLAPYEMTHPSEYELRPGDIRRLLNAHLIIYAGYENMVDQIKTGLEIPEENLLQITTNYNFAAIEESVMSIAERIGTEQVAVKNIEEIRQLLEKGQQSVHKRGLDTKPAVVHYFQEAFAHEMGINPLQIFGPAPPEPKQILSLKNANPRLIIDNAHNPVGGPVRETVNNADYIMLLNFPGMHQTRTLTDVIKYNIDQLIKLK